MLHPDSADAGESVNDIRSGEARHTPPSYPLSHCDIQDRLFVFSIISFN
jgi:hypothetical protein